MTASQFPPIGGIRGGSTICAISTAQGGAIGIVRVSGPDSIAICDKIFRGRKPLAEVKPSTVHYGNIIDASAKANANANANVDDVLVSIFKAPNSYTGEDSVEISCHGSSYILNKVLSLLTVNGCKLAKPGEYTQRAFLNGRMDLSQAEAVADLIASENASQHRIAMQQMRGSISTRLAELRQQLLTMTSLLELELDFSEEDVEFADRQKLLSLAKEIEGEIQHLSQSFATGNAIKNGIPVAIIGAPNVGKSTLLNQLLHDDRAIVSEIQGTTRDTIEDTITIDGTLFRFIDTAGIRKTDDRIESIGIDRSLKAAEKAQIIILMRDNENDYPTLPVRPDQTIIKVFNKSEDFQALTGKGLDWLQKQLLQSLQLGGDGGGLIITNTRHFEALNLALADIQRSIHSLQDNLSGDLVSEDLRQCINHLAEITGGAITTDETLANIFSHFCIGK